MAQQRAQIDALEELLISNYLFCKERIIKVQSGKSNLLSDQHFFDLRSLEVGISRKDGQCQFESPRDRK